MLSRPQRIKPIVTWRWLLYLALDVVGMLQMGIGLIYLLRGPGIFFPDFPGSHFEAVAMTGGGLGLMVWSVTRMAREQIIAQHARAQRDAEESR